MIAKECRLLDAHNLSLRLGERELFQNLSFSASPGEFVAVVGSSGSGKTSLLRTLAGEIEPETGRVETNSPKSLAIGMIRQDLELAEGSTAFKNALSGCLHRHSGWQTLLGFPEEEKRRALKLLDQFGLRSKINQWTSTLSRGERQRLAIARTLLASPSILLADEPVASLDSDWALRALEILHAFARDEDASVICSLHDQGQVKKFADRIIRIESSEVVETAKSSQSEQQ